MRPNLQIKIHFIFLIAYHLHIINSNEIASKFKLGTDPLLLE